MSANDATLLVTGASGQLGRRVVELLLDRRAGRIVATTRRPERLDDLVGRGVTVRRADFDEPTQLSEAFAGADRLLLVSTDVVDVSGRRLKQHRAAIEGARRAGVGHVVYTSFFRAVDSPLSFVQDHAATEAALARSGLRWTALCNNMYTDILPLILGLRQAITSGQLVAAAGEGGAAFITREDCARAAAAALASADAPSGWLEITGPAVVTVRTIARIVSDIVGRSITYVPVPPEVLRAKLLQAAVRMTIAETIIGFQVEMAEGRLAPAGDAIRRLTGRSATSVRDFLAEQHALLSPADR